MAYPPRRREERKAIDTSQVVAYLTAAFNRATRHLGYKNARGSKLYKLQVEFMWLVLEITTGPCYIVPKHIQTANEMIDGIIEEARSEGRNI